MGKFWTLGGLNELSAFAQSFFSDAPCIVRTTLSRRMQR